jgi:transcriptional regulator with XRE-family HTH domain
MAGDDWERLGHYATRARGRQSRQELATAAGVSDRTLGDIERGKAANYQGSVRRALEFAWGWEPGDFERVLAGGEPRTGARRGPRTVNLDDPRISEADREMLRAWLRERGIDPQENDSRHAC